MDKPVGQPQFSLTTALSTDLAQWIQKGLRGFADDVNSIVPRGFEAYARIFHPFYEVVDKQEKRIPWAEVASANSKTIHRQMQWPHLVVKEDDFANGVIQGRMFNSLSEGSLELKLATELHPILAAHTQTPSLCWFAIWYGYGTLPEIVKQAALFETFDRQYHLFQGSSAGIEQSFSTWSAEENGRDVFFQSANIWWPDDTAWCVATEIDLCSTYVGGTRALVEAIVSSPVLEAVESHPTDRIDYGADEINCVAL